MAAAKKGPPDLGILLAAEPAGDELELGGDYEEPKEEGGELPPGFMSAFEEMKAAETPEAEARAFYDAILACKAAHG